jgi:hypothetical protein
LIILYFASLFFICENQCISVANQLRYGHNSDKWGEHIGSPLLSVMSIFVGTDLRVCPIVIIFGYFVIMTKPQLIFS